MATPLPAPKGLTTMAALADAASTRTTITDLIAREEERFLERQPRSAEMAERAALVLAGGATSNWMIARPATVWVSHGKGSKVYDVDGTEYVDLHGGYGVMVVGPRPPGRRGGGAATASRLGTHFAQPTEDAIVVAEELCRRFGLPCGGSATRAPRRRWTPSTSCGPSPAAT